MIYIDIYTYVHIKEHGEPSIKPQGKRYFAISIVNIFNSLNVVPEFQKKT